MTDTTAGQPAGTTTAETASTSSEAGAGGAGAATAASQPAWYEGLQDEKLRTSPSIQRYKTVDDFAKGFANMEKRLGVPADRQITLPADPADKDGMRAVLSKVGLPDKPDGYGLKLADDAPEGDKARLQRFSERMHAAGGLTPAVQEALAFWQEETEAGKQAALAAQEERKTQAVSELKKEYGAAYDDRVKAVGQLLNRNGSPKLAEELAGTELGNNPELIRALSNIAEKLVEPGALSGANLDAAGPDRQMTPAQAKAAEAALRADPVKGGALFDKQHPMHMSVVKERAKLLAWADGKEA